MPRLDETPSLDPMPSLRDAPALVDEPHTFDPLDEAYALAPLPVDGASSRAGFVPAPPAPPSSADVIPLSRDPLPDGRRSTTLRGVAGDHRTERGLKLARFNDPARFTLRNLLLVITMASVVLAIGVRFPRPYFAGAVGLAALVTAVSASWLRGGGAVLQLAWWTLLGIYLMACGFALAGL